jgi:hypothetical protein
MAWSIESILAADVAADDVFRRYADPASWRRWAHDTAAAAIRGQGPLRAGAIVEVRAAWYPVTWNVRILELLEGVRLVTLVRPPGVEIVSTYEVLPAPHGARLRHRIQVSGPLASAYGLLRGSYRAILDRETRALADLVRADGASVAAAARTAA